MCKNAVFALKIRYFRPFFENLSMLVKYSTGVEYSEGSEKFFPNQKYTLLQSLIYRMSISFLVLILWKKRQPPPKTPVFGGWVGFKLPFSDVRLSMFGEDMLKIRHFGSIQGVHNNFETVYSTKYYSNTKIIVETCSGTSN